MATFWQAILTNKVRQIGLAFGQPSGLIRGYVHARLQVCMQQLQTVPPWLTSIRTHRQHFDQLI